MIDIDEEKGEREEVKAGKGREEGKGREGKRREMEMAGGTIEKRAASDGHPCWNTARHQLVAPVQVPNYGGQLAVVEEFVDRPDKKSPSRYKHTGKKELQN